MSMSDEDRKALLSSEVYRELEKLTRQAQQSLSDKIVQSPSAQAAIRDGIAKALENKADDWEDEHEGIKSNIKKLDDHVLFEFSKMFDDELKLRGLDGKDYVKEFDETEDNETDEDEAEEEEEMKEVFAYVKKTLVRLAEKAVNDNNIEAAYMIERCIDKL